jgi:integrase
MGKSRDLMEKLKTVAPGIRQKPNNDYLVTKSIKGERYYFTTKKLPEAKRWHRDFRPIPVNVFEKEIPTVNLKMNGRDNSYTLAEVWKKYQRDHLSTLAEDSQHKTRLRLEKFAKSLMSLKMCQMNEDVIEAVINERKILTECPFRCNFNKELKILNHVFNWYSNNLDPKFMTPINDFHKRVGKIKATPVKPKHITEDELVLFFKQLSGIWKSLAFMQLYMAGRIGEAAGLTAEFIHEDDRKIEVSRVMTWPKGSPKPKETTKTDTVSFVHINDHMMQILEELESNRPKNCPYLFHVKGKPLRLNWIYKAYNTALEAAGLPYTGTHILRYGMAGISGKLLGDEGAKAATRHGSMAMARKYRGKSRIVELTDENKEVVIYAEKLFKKEA